MKDNSFKKKANAATPHICNLRTPRIANRMNANTWRPVSYTHLTLPTILTV